MDVTPPEPKQGVIRFTGLGGTTVSEMAHLIRRGNFDVVLTAFNYSILWREAAAEVIPAAKEKGMGIIIGSPLQQGALARRYDDLVNRDVPWLSRSRRDQFKRLYALADECGIPMPEMGLRFAASNRDIHCVLMGARSATETEQNVAAMAKGPLAPELLRRLDDIAALVPYRPYGEPFALARPSHSLAIYGRSFPLRRRGLTHS